MSYILKGTATKEGSNKKIRFRKEIPDLNVSLKDTVEAATVEFNDDIDYLYSKDYTPITVSKYSKLQENDILTEPKEYKYILTGGDGKFSIFTPEMGEDIFKARVDFKEDILSFDLSHFGGKGTLWIPIENSSNHSYSTLHINYNLPAYTAKEDFCPVTPFSGEFEGAPALLVKDLDENVMEMAFPDELVFTNKINGGTPTDTFNNLGKAEKQYIEEAYVSVAEAYEWQAELGVDVESQCADLGIDPYNLYFREVSWLDVPQSIKEALTEAGNSMDLKIKIPEYLINKKPYIIIVYDYKPGEFILLPQENITYNTDGTVTLKLPKIGVLCWLSAS